MLYGLYLALESGDTFWLDHYPLRPRSTMGQMPRYEEPISLVTNGSAVGAMAKKVVNVQMAGKLMSMLFYGSRIASANKGFLLLGDCMFNGAVGRMPSVLPTHWSPTKKRQENLLTGDV